MAAAQGYTPVLSTQTSDPKMSSQQATNVMQSGQQTQTMMQHPQQMQTMFSYNTVPYYGQQNPGNQQVSAPQIVTPYQYVPAGNIAYPPLPNSNAWTVVQSYKKRVRSPEQITRNYKQKKMSDYWLSNPIQTTNSFSSLADEGNKEQTEKRIETEPKPPPIFVEGVQNIQPLFVLLDEVAKDSYTIKTLYGDQVKIQPATGENYTNIIQGLKAKQTNFHTYKPKQERSFRAVLKNLHPSTDIDEVKSELEKLGHTVINISNIKNRITKNPLSMFYVDFKQKENNKEIYKVTRLLNTIVSFEAPHIKREIPQCARCQRFGHTKNFCHKPTRCVKCTGDHSTKDCIRKENDKNVKCVNCGGAHPANYRGCTIHKQLQQRLYPALRGRNLKPNQANNLNNNNNLQQTIISPQMVQPGLSYAQQASQPAPNQFTNSYQSQVHPTIPVQQPNDIEELKIMMKKLTQQIETMLNLLTTLVSKMA